MVVFRLSHMPADVLKGFDFIHDMNIRCKGSMFSFLIVFRETELILVPICTISPLVGLLRVVLTLRSRSIENLSVASTT